MRIVVDNQTRIHGAPALLTKEIGNLLTIQNPRWIENKKMGRWNGGTPRLLRYFERTPDVIITPRGCTQTILSIARDDGISPVIDDHRKIHPVGFKFNGQLRPFQQLALSKVLNRDFGVIQAPTGAGKTVIGLAAIAARGQSAIIIVHTKELLTQWMDRIKTFLQIPTGEIGVIGSGKIKIGARITVAMVQTLYKCAQDVAPHIGFVLVDECHRCPSRTFTAAVSAFDCRYVLGLSATLIRRDKLEKLIFWYLGDLVHQVKKEDLLRTGDVLPAEIVIRETKFETRLDPSRQYSQMLSELTQDHERNLLIARDVAAAARNGGGTCLCLSDRRAHCEAISELLRRRGLEAPVLTGETPGSDREAIVKRLNEGSVKVVCATSQLCGEGFDCKALQTLFLATPVKFDGRVLQYIGRILRPAPGKKTATVFDYHDVNVPVLAASARSRQRVYDGIL